MKTSYLLQFVWFVLVAANLVSAQETLQIDVNLERGYPRLQWPNTPGQVFELQRSTDLAIGQWNTVALITTDAATAVWTDENEIFATRFYRVATSGQESLAQQLQATLDNARHRTGINGVSVAMITPRDGTWVGTSGKSFDESEAPAIRPQTRFSVASNTKMMVSALILQLAEAGILSLEDPLSDWLPEIVDPARIAGSITVRQLLNHTSGIDEYLFGPAVFKDQWLQNLDRAWQPEELVSVIEESVSSPGSEWRYTNSNYVLLGMIAERAAQNRMVDEFHRRFFDSFDLGGTYLGGDEPLYGEFTVGQSIFLFRLDWPGPVTLVEGENQRGPLMNLSWAWGMGNLVSTAENLARWSQALYGGRILWPSSLYQMTAVVVGSYDDRGVFSRRYGLGFSEYETAHGPLWGHGGGDVAGNTTLNLFSPEFGYSLVIIFNEDDQAAFGFITRALLQVIHGQLDTEKDDLVSEILRNGAGALDLSGRNLRDANLTGAKLAGADLSRSNLSGAQLQGADLTDALLDHANLRGITFDEGTRIAGKWRLVRDIITDGGSASDLSGIDLNRTDLAEAKLRDAQLQGTLLNDANLRRAELVGANLSGAMMNLADLIGADLSGADVTRAELYQADLGYANLTGAKLDEANLNEANLFGANLFQAQMIRADLSAANLNSANLRDATLAAAILVDAQLPGAILHGTDLGNADLTGANLMRADLREANLSGTLLTGADLSRADTQGTIFAPLVPLIEFGATWRYLDNGSDQGTTWRQPDFDDQEWKEGAAKLGYGISEANTVLEKGPFGRRHPTYYFRHTFHLQPGLSLGFLKLSLLVDDGAVVYLNGHEIKRSNIQDGEIQFATFALEEVLGSDANPPAESVIQGSSLRVEKNVLAVELHVSSRGNSDALFDLKLDGIVSPE